MVTLAVSMPERWCSVEVSPDVHGIPDPAILAPRAFTVEYFGLTYKGNTRDFIDRRILREGAYELYELRFLEDALRVLARPSPAFVDVGANTGVHMLYMANHATAVHAFEPFPPLVERLREQVAINHLSHVVVHPEGLGAEAAQLPFFMPEEANLGTGTFVASGGQGRSAQTLRIVRGDDALAPELDVAAIKIDVEGYEKPVLKGLAKTLERCQPVVAMELNQGNEMSFRSLEELRAAFPAGYRFAQISVIGARWIGGYALEELTQWPRGSGLNIAAFPGESSAALFQLGERAAAASPRPGD